MCEYERLMEWRRRLGAVAIAVVVGACQSGTESSPEITSVESDSAGITIVEIDGDPSLLPAWSLASTPSGVIDGNLEPYLTNIGETEWLSDGRIVVEDNLQDALYLFDAQGGLLRTLGDKGDGPGQFQNITEMTVLAGDSIFVYDRSHDRLSVLHPDDGFVRSVQFGGALGGRPPLDVFAIAPDRVVVQVSVYDRSATGALPRRLDYETHLYLTDGEGELLEGPLTFPGGFSVDFDRGNVGAPYSNRSVVAVAPGRLVHGGALHHDLTIRDENFAPQRRVRWAGWAGPIPQEELDEMVAGFDSAESELPPALVSSLREALYSPSLQPDLRPALSWRSYVDPGGRIWLARFEPGPSNDRPTEWHILADDGWPLARMRVPDGTTIAAVAESAVLLSVQDSMDVPSLHLLDIIR